jgi:nucleotide-binding universal stress UspA family protein
VGTIVVGVDGSDAAAGALTEARRLAEQTGDVLLLVTVWRPLRGDFGVAYPHAVAPPPPEVLDADRVRAERVLADAAAQARRSGVEVETELAGGDPAAELCRIAGERKARLLAVGSHGHGPVLAAVLGSTSARVLHDTPCPLLVVREGCAT